jgi:hypothetical protein
MACYRTFSAVGPSSDPRRAVQRAFANWLVQRGALTADEGDYYYREFCREMAHERGYRFGRQTMPWVVLAILVGVVWLAVKLI